MFSVPPATGVAEVLADDDDEPDVDDDDELHAASPAAASTAAASATTRCGDLIMGMFLRSRTQTVSGQPSPPHHY